MVATRDRRQLGVLQDCPVLVMSVGIAHQRIEDEQTGETARGRSGPWTLPFGNQRPMTRAVGYPEVRMHFLVLVGVFCIGIFGVVGARHARDRAAKEGQILRMSPTSETVGVVIIAASLGSGGAEKQVVLLGNHLAAHGHRPLVLTLVDDPFRVKDLDSAVNYECLGLVPGTMTTRVLLPALARAGRLVKAHHSDVLVSFTDPANRLGWALQASGGQRHILSERSAHLGGWARVQTRRVLFRSAELVVTNTAATSDEIIRNRLAKPQKTRVIPNAVELPDSVIDRSGRDRPFRWICVARLVPEKDLPTLLGAFLLAKEENRDAELSIVGGGAARTELLLLSESMGLGRSVHFLGERSDIRRLLDESDAFVLSSVAEGLPNVLLEAGASGLPIVTTDAGGAREALPAENREMVVRQGSPEALAHAMTTVMDLGPDIRQSLGSANRRHIETHFSRRAVMDQWMDILIKSV